MIIKDASSLSDVEDWYVYCSSKTIQSDFHSKHGHDLTMGMDLEVLPGEGKKVFSDAKINQGLLGYAMNLDPRKVILVEGDCDVPLGFFADYDDIPLILRLKSGTGLDNQANKTAHILASIRDTPPERRKILCMIPEEPSEMRTWQFDDYKASLYAENAKKISNGQDHPGIVGSR